MDFKYTPFRIVGTNGGIPLEFCWYRNHKDTAEQWIESLCCTLRREVQIWMIWFSSVARNVIIPMLSGKKQKEWKLHSPQESAMLEGVQCVKHMEAGKVTLGHVILHSENESFSKLLDKYYDTHMMNPFLEWCFTLTVWLGRDYKQGLSQRPVHPVFSTVSFNSGRVKNS